MNGELISRKIQLLHNLEDNIPFDQHVTNFSDVDLVRTDERWKRSFVQQVIDGVATMEPEISFSKTQLIRNNLASKLNSELRYAPENNVLYRQSVSEFNEISNRAVSHQKILPGTTGSGNKKDIKAVSFHAVLRELMQNRLAQHFINLREDLRIEVLAETSEQSNGCIVCFTQAKSRTKHVQTERFIWIHQNVQRIGYKVCSSVRAFNPIQKQPKQRVRINRARQSLLNPKSVE